MDNKNIDFAWSAVAPILSKFDFYDIKNIVGLAGFNIKILDGLGIDSSNWDKPNANQLVSEIGGRFSRFSDEIKQSFLNIVIEEILSDRYARYSHENIEERLQYCLNRLGWKLIENKVLPIDILDLSDLNELDLSAREDLIKAATKFRDGDLSGAILSSYAAVENVIAQTYQNNNFGEVDYGNSFQSRCKKSFEATGVYIAIDTQLSDIEWKDGDIKIFKKNLEGSVNSAALVLQLLRNNMSDAHGTKPVIKPLAFDSIKWSQIIVRLLSEKYDV
ncbi:MAG: hypothetical protein Q8Q54_07835 [Methylococcales bacterium]|nr:hypothetical protein [Methylococcales bacterium]MDP3010475.1 hypothetical protein [Methylococcales bacterium]MDP3838816.1 hypothetical protein [Methylococcales bacterium]